MRNDVVVKDDAVETAKSAIIAICIIVGVITLIAGVAVAVYKYLTPDYLDDFDEFDDDFDDDFFEDDADFTDDVAPAEASLLLYNEKVMNLYIYFVHLK